jgi:hypothetical protein
MMALGLPCLDMNSSFKQYSKVGYVDAKTWLERQLAVMKSCIPNWADTAIATELQNQLNPTLANLNQRIAEIKGTNLAKHYKQLHVPS